MSSAGLGCDFDPPISFRAFARQRSAALARNAGRRGYDFKYDRYRAVPSDDGMGVGKGGNAPSPRQGGEECGVLGCLSACRSFSARTGMRYASPKARDCAGGRRGGRQQGAGQPARGPASTGA